MSTFPSIESPGQNPPDLHFVVSSLTDAPAHKPPDVHSFAIASGDIPARESTASDPSKTLNHIVAACQQESEALEKVMRGSKQQLEELQQQLQKSRKQSKETREAMVRNGERLDELEALTATAKRAVGALTLAVAIHATSVPSVHPFTQNRGAGGGPRRTHGRQ